MKRIEWTLQAFVLRASYTSLIARWMTLWWRHQGRGAWCQHGAFRVTFTSAKIFFVPGDFRKYILKKHKSVDTYFEMFRLFNLFPTFLDRFPSQAPYMHKKHGYVCPFCFAPTVNRHSQPAIPQSRVTTIWSAVTYFFGSPRASGFRDELTRPSTSLSITSFQPFVRMNPPQSFQRKNSTAFAVQLLN